MMRIINRRMEIKDRGRKMKGEQEVCREAANHEITKTVCYLTMRLYEL